MNIVDKLTGRNGKDPEGDREAKMRHDVLFSQISARTGLGADNIDLSEVDFSISDDDLRAKVAQWRGITSAEAIADIDLDEVISLSGTQRRRARRAYQRQQAAKQRKGQVKFRRTQRVKRQRTVAGPSNHERVVAHRRRREQQLAVAALIRDGVDARTAYEQVVGT
jgi:hypothetical protein